MRAMSRGARITPVTPVAHTATSKEAKGDGEEIMSSPPV